MPRQPTVPRVCAQCGKEFLALSDNVKQGYGTHCSRTCVRTAATTRAAAARLTRFMASFTEDERGCWVWNKVPGSHGYGTVSTGHRTTVLAHRFAYEAFVGSIPAGMQIDHLCRNRRCVNPAHLEVVTPRENTVRGVESRRRERAA